MHEFLTEDQLRTTLIERNVRDILAQLADLRAALTSFVGIAAEPLPPENMVVKIGADDVSPFAMGFYAREFSDGKPFRWTGNSDLFEFRIFLNRNCDWKFVMRAYPAKGVNLRILRGFVDYTEIPLQFSDADNDIRGTVPHRLFSNQLILSFYHPEKMIPSRVDEKSVDHRSLCLTFDELQLSPELQLVEPPPDADLAPAPIAKRRSKGQRRA